MWFTTLRYLKGPQHQSSWCFACLQLLLVVFILHVFVASHLCLCLCIFVIIFYLVVILTEFLGTLNNTFK